MTAETRQRLKYLLADYISTNIALIAFNIFRYYELPSAFTAFYRSEEPRLNSSH